ncbi:hypothetical protein BJ994_000485 [Arthrobacter pigmenti]|uniref:Uncharacterized protein n=1 Tax=Arthrobacter pigmenti TaxID=271432 RepID=A0A846RJT7_9MICC|nr:hypothetical protein [Arthrobacter pigmenti]
MKAYRTIHQILFVFSFLPMILGWGPWYSTILVPLALIIPFGINEAVLEKRTRNELRAEHQSPMLHEYRNPV